MAMIKSRLSPNFAPSFDLDTVARLVGASTVCGLPPPGFNWSTAPPDELDKLGFAKRPDPLREPAAHAFWQKMFAPPLIFQAYDFKVLPFLTTPRSAFVAQFAPRQTSLNWSGAYLTPRDGTVFSSIWGAYQVPTPN